MLADAFHKKNFAEIVDGLLSDVASGTGGRTPLTDATEGSVVRTLMEVFAREMAVCYEQLDLVYRSAYLDTAGGKSLDYVVALTGLQRHEPGHLEGVVTFLRSQPAPQDIHIPAGTLVAGRDQPLFATVTGAVLAEGERLISVGALSVAPAEGATVVAAGALATMPRPIAGIEQVSNAAAMIPRQRAETDDELRQRARDQARSANTGTIAAIEQAVRSLGVTEVKVLEPSADRTLLPGQIHVVVGDPDLPPDLLEQVADRIEQVRPAGIVVFSGAATRVWIQITATLTLDADRPERERKAIESKLSTDLMAYFSQLGIGESVRETKIRSVLSGHDAVVGCEPSPGFASLMVPFVRDKTGALQPHSGRYLLTTGDIEVGPNERIGLIPADLPLRLTLQGPAPAVLVDIDLELVAGKAIDGVADLLKSGVGRVVTDAIKGGRVEWAPLKASVDLIVKPADQSRLRITVVHQVDGRVVELAVDQSEPLTGREVPKVRNVNVTAGS